MHIRFFPDGSPDCPIIAITDFTPLEVEDLRDRVLRLAAGEERSILLNGDVSLSLRSSKRDVGILESDQPGFSCALRPLTWDNIAGLLEPFAERDEEGFQWLDESGTVGYLSPDRVRGNTYVPKMHRASG
jgi:hypothetical protein